MQQTVITKTDSDGWQTEFEIEAQNNDVIMNVITKVNAFFLQSSYFRQIGFT